MSSLSLLAPSPSALPASPPAGPVCPDHPQIRQSSYVKGQAYDPRCNWVIQGDCRQVLGALPDRSVDLVFADPPYYLQLQNELRRPDNSLVDAVDDSWDQFDSFLDYDSFTEQWLVEVRRVMKDTGTLWVIGMYHNLFRIGKIMQDLGFWTLNTVVWEKANPTPHFRGVRFCNAHEELIWAAKSPKHARGYTFNYQELKLENGGKQMRSVWRFPICNGDARKKAADGSKLHTTEKPMALLQRIIGGCSRPGDLVLDPFGGTGTTAEAAYRLGRRFITIEQSPLYVDYGIVPRLSLAQLEMKSRLAQEGRFTRVQ